MKSNYDKDDPKSILEYAKKLIGHSLREMCANSISENPYSGKGKYGQLIEKYYFGYSINSNSEADFKKAGLELKATPLKLLKSKNKLSSKERLVLNIINYNEVIKQDFYNSDFWSKNSKLLLIFYLYKKEIDLLDYLIKLVDVWEFPETDLEIIKQDWEFIKNKILQGKAHELSEGDTYYLGACTKGANSSSVRDQPKSNIKAKQRAYSLKQGYVNHIIATIANEPEVEYGKIIQKTSIIKTKNLVELINEKFKPYLGKQVNLIANELGLKINPGAKNLQYVLTKTILGVKIQQEIEEFVKANITIKTVRLKSNNLPKESMSFPAFKFNDIASQTWDDTDFKEILESKFLFVFFRIIEDGLYLESVKLWNMPYLDLLEAEKVFNKTQYIIKHGLIVNSIKGNRRITNFPGQKDNKVAHVRPHALNTLDTFPLPVPDKLTNQLKYTKQSFWLNDKYIRDEIFLK